MSLTDDFKQKRIDELQAELDERRELGILEEGTYSLLMKLITNAETITEANDIFALGIKRKRTGLSYEHKLEVITDEIKYLERNDELSFATDENAKTHKLIIGDNYDALQNLMITHRGKIDVIYIDPPYGCDSMGEFAKTNYTNSLSRDNLLSMLHTRLVLARDLMTKDGVIFCSIDDRNQAYIRCLMDEVFGEHNFVCSFVWKKKSGGGNDSDNVVVDTEFIHCYAKDLKELHFNLDKEAKASTSYNQEDEHGKYALERLDKQNLSYSDSMNYDLVGPDGQIYRLEHKDPAHPNATWRWSKETVAERIDELVFKNGHVYTKNYEKTDGLTPRNLIDADTLLTSDEYGRSRTGSTDLLNIFGRKVFDNPKPVKLIKYLIAISSKSDSIVLDFFAGSSTTGEAVLELNREDGGQRQFVLATNNEITKLTPNGVALDVSTKRMKRIMTGECYDGTTDFKWLSDNKPYGDNLEVFDIAIIPSNCADEGKTPFDVIDETCYGLDKFSSFADKADWVCQNFERTCRTIKEG